MECQYHPGYKAVKTCEKCGAAICKTCAIDMIGGHTICHSCFMKGEERDAKWLRNFKIIAIVGILLFLYILYLGISKKGSSVLLRAIIVGIFVGSLPMSYFYVKTVISENMKTQASKRIQFISNLIIGPLLFYRAIQYYKMLENRLKRNKEIKGKLETESTKFFFTIYDGEIPDMENTLEELEKSYNSEDMRTLKESFIFVKEGTEDKKRKKEGENGKIKDEVLKEYDERLVKIAERIKKLDQKYPTNISAYDKLPFQTVQKINLDDPNKRKLSKEEEEYIEMKKMLYIEDILDMEKELKKLETDYDMKQLRSLKAREETIRINEIEYEVVRPDSDYGKIDIDSLEIFIERLKKLEERIEKLESKYQNI